MSNPQRDLNNILNRLKSDGNPQDRPIIEHYEQIATRHRSAPDPYEIEQSAADQVEPEELKGWINFEC